MPKIDSIIDKKINSKFSRKNTLLISKKAKNNNLIVKIVKKCKKSIYFMKKKFIELPFVQ